MNERIASGASLVTEIYLDHMFIPELVFDTWSYKRHFTFNLDLTFQLHVCCHIEHANTRSPYSYKVGQIVHSRDPKTRELARELSSESSYYDF